MKKYLIPVTFCVLVGVFVVIASVMLSSVLRGRVSTPLMVGSWVTFSSLGAALVFLTLRQKVEGKLRKFLILTGASSVGFLISVILHNLLYGLGTVIGHITALSYLVEALHIAFFFIAILICPLGFLVGVVGSTVLFSKKPAPSRD